MATTANQTQLDSVIRVTLQLADSIARLRVDLPLNHRLQGRLATMAREVTAVAKEIEKR